jgi:hypothetical protein
VTRPAWHGVKVGDRVRFRAGRVWWRVIRYVRRTGTLAEHRLIGVRRVGERRPRNGLDAMGWLTDIVERVSPERER